MVGSRTASVPPEKLQRLFDPVQMVQESLIDVGPAVSQRLVEALGGRLRTAPDTARVRLPRDAARRCRDRRRRRPLDAARILVVDDELGPRESLRMLLKPSYQIQTADSGRAALDQIPAYRPDIVILDIKMPELDGLEVLRRIKRIDPAIEVVMITAYASLETVKMALTHGAFEYLIKPFSRQDLEDVVRRALGRAPRRARHPRPGGAAGGGDAAAGRQDARARGGRAPRGGRSSRCASPSSPSCARSPAPSSASSSTQAISTAVTGQLQNGARLRGRWPSPPPRR